jgi:3-oxoacyl-[acyl-carrier protein] reductase
MVEHLLAGGAQVIALARRAPPLTHPALRAHQIDVGDVAAMAALGQALAKDSEVTGVVHNAGAMRPALVADLTQDDLQALLNLHVAGPVALTQALLPGMRGRGFGRIVFVSSRAALGLATRSAYSASKSALHGLARTWALELGAEGITVNVVAPGPIRTDMFHEVVPAGSDKVEQIARGIPVRRLGEPGDVARAVRFFLARDNGFVTGQVLYVCGGTSIGSITF